MQNLPLGHFTHSVSALSPVKLLYVPIGHKVAVSDPRGQKAPMEHTCYVLFVAPLVQFLVVLFKLLHRNASDAVDAVTKYSKRQK